MGGAALAQSETFFLELATASPEADVREWFEGAAPGAQAVYASGLSLPQREPGVVYVRGLVAAGLAITTSRRHPQDGRRFQFLVVKRDADALSASAVPAGGALNHQTRRELEALVGHLGWCASRGRVCPSNRELAAALDLGAGQRGRRRSDYLMRLAAECGLIAVESRGRNAPRVVTVLAKGRACGKSTLGVRT